MRWLPRRWRRETRETRDARPGLGLPPGNTHWRRLPPLVPTLGRPPLTVAASMGVAAADRSRPLLHAPGRTRPASRQTTGTPGYSAPSHPGVVPAVEPVAGRVTGLVAVRAEAPPEQETVVPPSARGRRWAPVPERGPVPKTPPAGPRFAPRVLASAGPRPNLVMAADEYVGDPTSDVAPKGSAAPAPDDVPDASSDWLRMLESYRPPWATEAGAAPPPPQGAAPPMPGGGTSWSSEATAAPPRPSREPRTGGPKAAARRASLAESRRLGLGNPLRRPVSPAARIPVEPSADSLDAPEPEVQDERPGRTRATEADSSPAPVADVDVVADADAAAVAVAVAVADADADAVADVVVVAEAEAEADGVAVSDVGRSPRRADAGPTPYLASDVAPDVRRGSAGPEAPVLGLAAPIDRPEWPSHGTTAGARSPRERTSPEPREPAPHAQTPAGRESGVQGGAVDEEDVRPVTPLPARPVYRFVPGERSAPPVAETSRPTGTAPTPTTPTTTPLGRPLVRPRARRRPDGARPEPEPHPPAPFPPPDRTAPGELVHAVRRAHGVDVSDVPIHRGPEVAAEARSLGARAFTRNGEVFLPADEGPFDQPVARGLLAHELTHAAQQRALGPALPPEDSDGGSALEAEAVATEMWARGLGAEPAEAAAAPAASWTAPWHTAPASGVQRQPGDVTTMVQPGAVEPPQPQPRPPTTAPGDGTPSGFQVSQASQGPVTGAQTARTSAPFDEELLSVRDRLIELSGRRPLDLDDPGDIEEVAVQVYEKIHRRLRRELLVDRERAGRLGATGPFGWAR
ncbi:DUF4157 domain-containing protein [Streptomyces sp. NPDC048278]|uniref:eCIS core domain-containing protein n=1 Tax=Streptomyces sp. NPDC048278 TaxID=3155809 RepID=UPI0034202162